jgi:hypothetical protein
MSPSRSSRRQIFCYIWGWTIFCYSVAKEGHYEANMEHVEQKQNFGGKYWTRGWPGTRGMGSFDPRDAEHGPLIIGCKG